MYGVAGEEVLAAAGVADALADRDQVEDRTDVAEERIVTLPGEDLDSTRKGLDRVACDRVVAIARKRGRSPD